MERIELHDVEYGDCTVLVGKNRTVLFVDCGSVSRYARDGEDAIHTRFASVFARYAEAAQRQFLLTHYHRDHMSGFLWQIERDPRYFDRVYLPALPVSPRGESAFLEVALFAHFFAVPQSAFSLVNTACLTIFDRLDKTVGAERVFTLSAGDSFSFDGLFYEVLSPGPDFPEDETLLSAAESMNIALSSPRLSGVEAQFLAEKEAFLRLYAKCLTAFRLTDRATPAKRRVYLDALSELWARLSAMREALSHSPAAPDVREILEQPLTRTAYSDLQNDLSLVFHNTREGGPSNGDILMPGDVSDAVLTRLSPKLFDGYYAVKAPHHGTDSHFSRVLGDMAVSHLLISNGDYHAGGEISTRYIDMECVRHCTNRGACKWFQTAGSCCNRLMRCYDQRAAGTLTLRCPAVAGNRKTPCNIYVFGADSTRGCLCD